MATEETLQKLREIGRKLRAAREQQLSAAKTYAHIGYTKAEAAVAIAAKDRLDDVLDEIERLQEEAGRICETEL